jgi:CheY-like chemotaxis protein
MMRSPHILVVDDDTKIRRGVAKFLGEQGMRVTATADGREMLDKLAGARIGSARFSAANIRPPASRARARDVEAPAA